MTSDEFLECIIREMAAEKIAESQVESCYALKISESNEILHVFPPSTNIFKAKDGARTFECDVVSMICEVSYKALPLYKIYRSLENVEIKENVNTGQIPKSKASFRGYKDVELGPHALRKFTSTGTTTFLAIKDKDAAYIELIFPRGTNFNNISKMAVFFGGDIVLVKARVNYEIKPLAKLECTYEQIRKGK